ncbi:MAG TPA: hypothetical protein VF263_01615 [Longimicrobiaceae bacterium]
MQIELLEPGAAIPKGRGYVGVGKAGDEIFFPHVDSCCAVVGVFNDGAIIGGHIGAEWPGVGVNRAFSTQRVFTLMTANMRRVKADEIKNLALVYPHETGWDKEVNAILQTWYTDGFVNVDTRMAGSGVDVLVTHTHVFVTDLKTNLTKEFVFSEDPQAKTFP